MSVDDRLRSTRTDRGLGQNGLYQHLLRCIAKKQRGEGKKESEKVIMAELHVLFQLAFNYKVPYPDMPELKVPRGTSSLSVTEFSIYFTHAQEAAIRLFGVSGMKEDSKPFDHGGKTD